MDVDGNGGLSTLEDVLDGRGLGSFDLVRAVVVEAEGNRRPATLAEVAARLAPGDRDRVSEVGQELADAVLVLAETVTGLAEEVALMPDSPRRGHALLRLSRLPPASLLDLLGPSAWRDR